MLYAIAQRFQVRRVVFSTSSNVLCIIVFLLLFFLTSLGCKGSLLIGLDSVAVSAQHLKIVFFAIHTLDDTIPGSKAHLRWDNRLYMVNYSIINPLTFLYNCRWDLFITTAALVKPPSSPSLLFCVLYRCPPTSTLP